MLFLLLSVSALLAIGLLADYINPNTSLVIALTHNQIPSEYSGDPFASKYCVLESDSKTNLFIHICHCNYFEFLYMRSEL